MNESPRRNLRNFEKNKNKRNSNNLNWKRFNELKNFTMKLLKKLAVDDDDDDDDNYYHNNNDDDEIMKLIFIFCNFLNVTNLKNISNNLLTTKKKVINK